MITKSFTITIILGISILNLEFTSFFTINKSTVVGIIFYYLLLTIKSCSYYDLDHSYRIFKIIKIILA